MQGEKSKSSDSSNNPPGDCEIENRDPMRQKNVGIDPSTIVINECMIVSASMRKLSRWSKSGVATILGTPEILGEEGSIVSNWGLNTYVSSGFGKGSERQDNPLLSSFLQLRNIVTEAADLYEIDSLTLLQPFLMVIKAPSTSGYITSLVLNSVTKFFSYGIISSRSKNLQSALIQTLFALTHCRFEAADQGGDDAVLLKVLKLLEIIMQSPLSSYLPNEVISEMVQTCLSLSNNKKRSEVLRQAAEMTMNIVTVRVFNKLQYIEPEWSEDDLVTSFSGTYLPEDRIGGTDEANYKEASTLEEYQNEIYKTSVNHMAHSEILPGSEYSKEVYPTEKPFGVACMNEFIAILVLMISPSNQYRHMESTRVLALDLLNVAIEIAGNEFPKHSTLMNTVSDPIVKYLLQIIVTAETPALLLAALQLFTTITIVMDKCLRPQFELSLTLLFNSILPESIKQSSINGNRTSLASRSSTSKEMLIEALSLLWIRSPAFFSDLFINFDCDFERSDLAKVVLSYLCTLSLPESAEVSSDSVPPICLEGVLTFISNVFEQLKTLPHELDVTTIAQNELLTKKEKKQSFVECTKVLNKDPKEGIERLAKDGFFETTDDTEKLAEFLFTKSDRLNKQVLGEYLVKPSNQKLLSSFIDQFDFANMRVDEALRLLLKSFRLPGESQQIERVVERFAERYVVCQKTVELDPNEQIELDIDAVFILSYSIILLNTDLHNPQVKKQMDLESYKRNVRGVYNGGDFPEWYLSKIYHAIKEREIIMPEEHHGTEKWFDDVWNNMIRSLSSKQEKLNYADFNNFQICQFNRALFESVVDDVINTLVTVFEEATDDHIVTRLMSSIDKCATICIRFKLFSSLDKLVYELAKLTNLTGDMLNVHVMSESVRDEIPETQIRIRSNNEMITVTQMAVWFGGEFKAQISTVVLFRLLRKANYKVTNAWLKVLEIIMTFFENCLINPNVFPQFQEINHLEPIENVKARYVINRSKPLRESGILSTFSSFLKGYSDIPPEPSDQEVESTLSTIDCVRSLGIQRLFEFVDRDSEEETIFLIRLLLDFLPTYSKEKARFFEEEVLFLLELSIFYWLKTDKDRSIFELIKGKLKDYSSSQHISMKNRFRMKAYDLILLQKSEFSLRGDVSDVIEVLSKCEHDVLVSQGTSIIYPLLKLIERDPSLTESLLEDERYWTILRMLGSTPSYSRLILDFIENKVLKHRSRITESNLISILGVLDEISSSGAIASLWELDMEQLKISGLKSETENTYFRDLINVSISSVTLTAEFNNSEALDSEKRYALLQAIAHQCFNPCREIRRHALNILKHVVLSSELHSNTSTEGVFENGIFPLMKELSKVDVVQTDTKGFLKTQIDLLSLVSKIFLHYSGLLDIESVQKVWFGVLEYFAIYNTFSEKFGSGENLVQEFGGELLKNMILVLLNDENALRHNQEFWKISWEKIGKIYPHLENEVSALKGQTESQESKECSERSNDTNGGIVEQNKETLSEKQRSEELD